MEVAARVARVARVAEVVGCGTHHCTTNLGKGQTGPQRTGRLEGDGKGINVVSFGGNSN